MKAFAALLSGVVTILVATALGTALLRALPGDPAELLAGPRASIEQREAVRSSHHLGEPLHLEIAMRLRGALHGAGAGPSIDHRDCYTFLSGKIHSNLGRSPFDPRPVSTAIAQALPVTLRIGAAAWLLQVLLGIGGALLAARVHKTRRFVAYGFTLILCVPGLLIGALLQHALAVRLNLLPLDGTEANAWVLPVLTLGVAGSVLYFRSAFTALQRAHRQPSRVQLAAMGASLGLRFRRVDLPAVGRAVFEFGLVDVAAVASGALITETLFRQPGMGSLASTAISNRDAAMLFGVLLASAAFVVCITHLGDAIRNTMFRGASR